MKQEKSKEQSIPIFNPQVVARRAIHEKVVLRTKKQLSNLMGGFALFGLVFLLLPAVIQSWRHFLEHVPMWPQFFDFYVRTRQGGYFTLHLAAFLAVFRLIVYVLYRRVYIVFLEKADPPQEFYPQTRKEELGFWMEVCFQLGVTSTLIYFPFGLIASMFVRG